MATNNNNIGLTPNYILFNQEGDVLVAGPSGGVGLNPRGKALSLGPAGYVLSSNGLDAVWVPYTENPGTVTSVNVTGSAGFTITGGPITTNGIINIAFTNPALSQNGGNVTGSINLQDGNFSLTAPVSGGTVTSVAASSDGSIIISGSPITSSGTIGLSLATQPIISGNYNNPTVTVNSQGIITAIANGTVSAASLSGNLNIQNFNYGTGASTYTFWRGDGTWDEVVGNATPQNLGVASPGSSSLASSEDHVHALPTATQVGALPITGGSITGSLVIGNNLTVNGTMTIINTETLEVADINIVMGAVVSPTDITANGGGPELLGTTTKSITWANDGNTAWTSSENFNLSTAKIANAAFTINNVSVLNSTTLGSSVVNSSLTSVGIITSGTWSGSFGAVSGANLTNLTAANISAGTAGINITGNASTVSTNANLTGDVTSVGNATSLVATSNSTLTTLSSLSLPGSQVTGNISGNATNITGTSNSTLTTLSSLSLPASQVTGLGSAALEPSSAFLQPSNNLSDVSNTNAALNTLLPTQSSNTGKFLQTNGANTSWVSGATGSVTEVSTDSTLTGGPITSSGTLGINLTNANTWTATQTFSNTIVGNISGNSATVTTNADLTGDVTSVGNVTTLTTVNSDTGTFASVVVNGKGLVTAAANLSGDITTSSSIATLATVNTDTGTYNSVTVNAKGLVTAASNVSQVAGSAGSIQFSDGTDFAASANLFWDNTDNRLGINNSSPAESLDVTGNINTTGNILINEVQTISSDGITSLGYVAEKNYDYITSGVSSTVSNNCSTVIFNIPGPSGAYDLTTPAAPVDGQILKISASTASSGISLFTLTANAGQTIDTPPLSAFPAGGAIAYIYVASVTTWFPTA